MFTMSIESTHPYLTVNAAGPAGLEELSDLVAFIAEIAKDGGHTQVLANLCELEPTMSFTDHLRFGALVWEVLGGLEQMAAVVPPGYLDGAAVRAAKLAGMPMHMFPDLATATQWLGDRRTDGGPSSVPALPAATFWQQA
jgi:hypothetical protein